MFIADSGSMSHMVNSLSNMKKLRDVKKLVKTGNKKMMTCSFRGYWKRYQKRDGKFYPVTCNETEYIPDLSVNIFSMTRALTKAFNMTSEKESLVLKENKTILKFEERLP